MNKPQTPGGSNKGRRALGRGLGALIPKGAERREFFQCPISRILPNPSQPRQALDPDELTALTESIVAVGVIQPLVVHQDGANYRLIAGERRFRAAKAAGIETLPVVIKEVDEDLAFEMALVENIQRADLNPLEEAEAYQRLMAARGYTQAELASRLGKSRPAVANTLRLLGLHADVQRKVTEGALSEGAARALLALPTADHQVEVAEAAVGEELSVRQVESVVKRIKTGDAIDVALAGELAPSSDPVGVATAPKTTPRQGASKSRDDPQVQALKEELQRSLGTRVTVHDRGGKGSIEVFFDNYGVLDSILERLRQL